MKWVCDLIFFHNVKKKIRILKRVNRKRKICDLIFFVSDTIIIFLI